MSIAWPEGVALTASLINAASHGMYPPANAVAAELFNAVGKAEPLQCCVAVEPIGRSAVSGRLALYTAEFVVLATLDGAPYEQSQQTGWWGLDALCLPRRSLASIHLESRLQLSDRDSPRRIDQSSAIALDHRGAADALKVTDRNVVDLDAFLTFVLPDLTPNV